ncbi:hypothetical protein HMPREF9120_00930 [Neisseria sp. oral taxon 020 str. F0370]|nr:hypothetical protein HMPREF9120_00930 [Neisseria sp. oral taxon 020 str. F0370]
MFEGVGGHVFSGKCGSDGLQSVLLKNNGNRARQADVIFSDGLQVRHEAV